MKRRSGRHLLNCTQQHMAQAHFRWKSNKAVSSVHHSRNKGRMHVDLHRKWLSLASANVLKQKKSVEGERMNDSNADRGPTPQLFTLDHCAYISTWQSSQHTHGLAPYHNISLASHLRIVYSNGQYVRIRHPKRHCQSFHLTLIITIIGRIIQ